MDRRSDHRQRQEATEREAVDWLLRVERADAAEADWLALQAWLEAAPENREAFDRAERVSAELVAAAADLRLALEPLAPQPVVPAPIVSAPRRSLPRDRGRRLWRSVAGLAAAAAAAVVAVAVLRTPAPAPTETYQTAKGESRTVDLADGSHVHLNTATRIAVRLERDTRHVELVDGEAAFEVAKDASRPFLIAAGDRTVRVVGTEFDVLRHSGRLQVTVRSGTVAVQPADAPAKARPLLLRAGDQFDRRAGTQTAVLRRVDPETAFAWRRGDLIYRDQPLAEVAADLSRYFETPLSVAGPAADLRFSGVLKIESEEALVRRLQAFLPVVAERSGQSLVLRMRTSQG